MNALIPKPVTPLIDERTGMISREWFRYFDSLSNEDDLILLWASVDNYAQ